MRDSTGLPAGKVRVTVTDANGGSPISGSFDINVNPGSSNFKYYLATRETEAMPVCGLQTTTATATPRNYRIHQTDSVDFIPLASQRNGSRWAP